MKQKISFVLAICCLLPIPLAGCADYRGLDELTIVLGIAIDQNENDPDLLDVAFEVVDKNASSGAEIKSALLETRGKTITEAIHRADEKLHRNMYFGNTEIVVLSRKLAEGKGLVLAVDPLMRNGELRDDLYILISGEDTARELLEPSGSIVSFHLNQNLPYGDISANSTRPYKLYEINRILGDRDGSVALPEIRFSNREKKEITLNGLALFSGPKMVGRLEENDVPYYLLAKSRLTGGSFAITREEDGGKEKYAAITINSSRPKHSFDYDGERFSFLVTIDMEASAVEFSEHWGEIDGPSIRLLEKEFEALLAEEVRALLLRLHKEEKVDIVGFADSVRQSDLKLWREASGRWPQFIEDANVDVMCKMRIWDTGLIRQAA